MRNIIKKKKMFTFKHEKNNQTLSNDWPTYCQTRIFDVFWIKNIGKYFAFFSESLLFKAKSAISWREQVIFNAMMMMSALYLTNTLHWFFVVLAHWNNSACVSMSPHPGTLSWFRTTVMCLQKAYISKGW
jgi:hypothetical protein